MSFLAPIAAIATAASSIFGGGDKPAKQSNVAFDQLNKTYTPQTQTGVNANNYFANLLGVTEGGDPKAGLQGYLDMAGYAPALEKMQRGVIGGQAARGLLNSGSTQRRLLEEGSKIDQSYVNNYFQLLNTLNSQGLTAGQLIGQVGQQNVGAQQGLGSKIGNAVGSIPALTKGFKDLGSIFS